MAAVLRDDDGSREGETFPAFFQQAPVVRVSDPLSRLLGVSADGVITYRYADAVRLAGHSCPTVAGTYLMGRAALAALYPRELPERGAIAVNMPDREDEGVTGVIAQVLTLLTGAAGSGGFPGIGGHHARRGLLGFDPVQDQAGGGVTLRRLDTGRTVTAWFDPSVVPMDSAQPQRLRAILQGQADAAQLEAFGQAWQERVRRMLLEHAEDPDLVWVESAD
ncbi:hypothetical protein H0Z60_12685 [Ectothiorhodospiraceae bacterium WFHF3C12]|nr:hypothetical protein [Ectothiorhodospiraceae bacterium WFHF3C12]